MSLSTRLALRNALVYEIEGNYGRAIHPIPTLTNATCTAILVAAAGNRTGLLFREDSFDPVSRVRRGRMYVYVENHVRGYQAKNIHNYPFGEHIGVGPDWRAESLYRPLSDGDINTATPLDGAQVDLGDSAFQTVWRVVGAERISTGDLLFTLRAISALGAIPRLAEAIQNEGGDPVDAGPVLAALDTFVDALHVQQPVPVVDVGRETARVILTTWRGPVSAQTKDLGKVIEGITSDKDVARWAASIINRLHPRGKSAEQEKQAIKGIVLRPIIDEDAETCAHLIGLLLREIGWAKP